MGFSDSGKTTVGRLLADRLGWKSHDADDFHPETNRAGLAGVAGLSDEDRAGWLLSLREQLIIEMETQRDAVILACSTLRESYGTELIVGEEVSFVYLLGPFEQIERLVKARRDHFMKLNLLEWPFEILEEPADAVVVDIGNTPDEMIRFMVKELNL